MTTSNHPPVQRPFLTDGGLETTLIYHHGIALPEFASFHLLRSEEGRETLRDYFRTYLELAADLQCGFLLESATWRANPDWGSKLGYDERSLRRANELAIRELFALREEYAARVPAIRISGCLGPRGDGYLPSAVMTAKEAEAYHGTQVRVFAEQGAEAISAMTLNYVEEAIGVVRAAKAAGIPSVISFTLETDGCLPTGETLQTAVERTDAETDGAAAYYMINCAHPTHFEQAFANGDAWLQRLGGIRANASRLSHAELEACDCLDEGDPADLADRMRRLQTMLPALAVFGGCCGTDHRHIEAIGKACIRPWARLATTPA